MPHTFEPASSGRSKCRGCGVAIGKGEIRFGERLANPFGEGEVTHWFHPVCAAYKRPDAVLETLNEGGEVADREALDRVASATLAHTRLQRIDGAERSPSSQARCRHCKEPIEKGTWRIRLVFHEEGNFAPGGFIHVACRGPYFEATGFAEQVLHFSPALAEADRAELKAELEKG